MAAEDHGMPDVYISHTVSPWELAQVYVLARETERQGLQTFIPDRNWQPAVGPPSHIAAPLRQSEIILVFATVNGHYLEWVNRELATASSKQVVALIERGIQVTRVAGQNIVEFNRSEGLASAIRRVTELLQRLELPQTTGGNLLTALVVGGLILVLLRAVGGGDEGT
jgi:hypothetical protein